MTCRLSGMAFFGNFRSTSSEPEVSAFFLGFDRAVWWRCREEDGNRGLGVTCVGLYACMVWMDGCMPLD